MAWSPERGAVDDAPVGQEPVSNPVDGAPPRRGIGYCQSGFTLGIYWPSFAIFTLAIRDAPAKAGGVSTRKSDRIVMQAR